MADDVVQNAVKNWGPRFVQHGVDFNDYLRTVAKIQTWEGWLGPWLELGEKHEQLAKVAEEKGRKRTAGEAYLAASVATHFGKYLSPFDPRYEEAVKKSAQLMRKAHQYLDSTAERIEVPFDGSYIVGNLRRPVGRDRAPLMILVPGLDSTKEEFFWWENSFLIRGLATLSLDGPGQGEVGLNLPITAAYDRPVSAMIDVLEKRSDLDCSRIGIAGVSAGGYYAPRAAAFESRIKAVVSGGGVFNFYQSWDKYPPMILDKLLFDTRTRDPKLAKERTMDIEPMTFIHRVKQPYLILHSDQDWAFPLEYVEPIAKAAPNSELVSIPGGNHANSNYPYLWRPMVADWMMERLN